MGSRRRSQQTNQGPRPRDGAPLMGFMDQNAGGGGPPLMKWNGQEGKYLKYDSDTEFNDECFVLNAAGAVAGYLKFGVNGEQPIRHTGPIYAKDAAPDRAALGDTDMSEWPTGRFSGEPEDPWTAVVELPLRHQTTGEEFILTCQSKTAIGAAKDLFSQLRKVPAGHDPVSSSLLAPCKPGSENGRSRSSLLW